MIAGRLRQSTRTTSTRMRTTTQHLKDQILHHKHWKGLSRIYKKLECGSLYNPEIHLFAMLGQVHRKATPPSVATNTIREQVRISRIGGLFAVAVHRQILVKS